MKRNLSKGRLFDFFRSSSSRVDSRKAPKSRKLRLEGLEERQLLSVSAAEFAAIREAYSKLDLQESASDLNVVEIQAEDVSYASITRAIQEAAATPESDLIVLRTDAANYQLDLGDATIAIDVDSAASGSITLASFGPRALQIATTSHEGVFSISSGDVRLGGFALVGFSDYGARELVATSELVSLSTDSLTLLTLSNANVGEYSIDAAPNIADSQEELGAAPFTLIGSSDYYAARGLSNQQELGGDSSIRESWSVDFQYSETERGFLAGLSTEEAILITTGTGTFQTNVYYDADKGRASGDGDDYQCWAATCANMLYYTGWAPQSTFPDEEAVFDVFTENFVDDGGEPYYGNGWFIEGGHDQYGTLRDPDSGGYYASQLAQYNETYAQYAGWDSLRDTVSGMNNLASAIRAGDAIGLGVDWTWGSSYAGGHAITCWGYTYNDSYSTSSPNYYTRLFVTDSDDYQSEDRKLQDYGITWSTASSNGYLTGYIFDTYGYESATSFGFLYDYERLSPKPDKYVYTAEARLGAPTLTAVAGDDSITITVGSVANATEYVLQWGTSSDFSTCETRNLTEPGTIVFSDLQRSTTYYFRAQATADGYLDSAWTIATATTTIYADDYEPNDSRATAYDLGLVSGVATLNGNLHVTSDADWYKFSIADEGESTHYVKMTYLHASGFDLDIELYDGSGTYLAQSQKTTGVETISLSGLAAGDYYVCVYNYYDSKVGTYSLEISAPNMDGKLTRPTLTVAVVDDRFEATVGAVENATGYVLQYGVDSSFERYEQIELADAGTRIVENPTPGVLYCFRVKAIADGWIDSGWTTTSAFIYGDYEPNETRATAYDLGVLGGITTIATSINTGSDKDYFIFTTSDVGKSDSYVKLNYSHGSGADLDLKIYNASGTQVGSSTGTSGVENISMSGWAAGVYYAYVYNYYSSSTVDANYTLTISAPQPPMATPTVVATAKRNAVVLNISSVENADRYVVQYGEDETFETYAEKSYSSAGVKTITGLKSGTDYYFRVKATSEERGSSAWATVSATTLIVEDDFEPNDSRETASDLGELVGLATFTVSLHDAADVDWYAFSTTSEGLASDFVQIAYKNRPENALKLELYDAEGNLIATTTESTGDELISLGGLAAGDYYARVVNDLENPVSYELNVLAPGGDESVWIVTTTSDDATKIGSLRYALTNCQNGDRIVFADSMKGKTITLGGSQLDVDKSVTIDASSIWNSSANKPGITISGDSASRVFNVTAEASLFGLTVTKGRAYDGAGLCAVADVSISNCAFSDCVTSGGFGGGVRVYNANGTFLNCDFTACSGYYGSGAYVYGTGSFTNCSFADNAALSGYSGYGGGVYLNGTGSFVNCSISGNSAYYGGGAYVSGTGNFSKCSFVSNATASNGYGGGAYISGTGNFSDCSINGNSAYYGGGVYFYGSSTAKFLNCAISNNSANYYGGGVYATGTSTFTNCEISGNRAVNNYGGGVYATNGYSRSFTNCTISGNSAYNGGGIYRSSGSLTLKNSIVSLNYSTNSDYGVDIYGSINSSVNSLIKTDPGFVVAPTFNSNGVLTNADSLDLRLAPTSWAIDRGDNSLAVGTTDVAGNARKVASWASQATVDIGAYESHGAIDKTPEEVSLVVTTELDIVDDTDGLISLREAILYSKAGDTITFAPELRGKTITLGGSALVVDKEVAIDASSVWDSENEKPGITVNGADASRVFSLYGRASLIGLEITGGRASSGGGVFVNAVVTISLCSIRDNRASYGGGIYFNTSGSAINNSAVFANEATYGGGGVSGVATFTNCALTGNVAGSYGGGIFSSGTPTFYNTIIALNAAGFESDVSSRGYYGSNNLIGFDPQFVVGPQFSASGALLNGSSLDLRLSETSWAIDRGDSSLATSELDIAGNPRIIASWKSEPTIDIGAFEYQGAFEKSVEEVSVVVTTAEDIVDETDGEISLREALLYAEDGDVISFSEDLKGATIILNGSDLRVGKEVTIDGSGAGIVLDGSGKSRVLTVCADATILGLNLTNGFSYYGGGLFARSALTIDNCSINCNKAYNYGGGADFYYANVVMTNCEVRSNKTTNSSGYGGGIYAYYGTSDFMNCLVASNVSGYNGGGLYSYYGTRTLTNCSISDNSSSSYGGGAFLSYGTVAMNGCDVSGNTASGYYYAEGGGLYLNYGTQTLTNCSITKNVAKTTSSSYSSYGGGLYCYYGSGSFVNCAISGNAASRSYSGSSTYGGGVYTYGGTRNFHNTIIASNTSSSYAGIDVYVIASATLNARNTLSSYSSWSNASSAGVVNYVYQSSQPLFANAASGDYRLAANSQALDKGDASLNATEVDKIGYQRVYNGAIDLGPYEYGPRSLAAPTLDYEATSTEIVLTISPVENASLYLVEFSVDPEFNAFETRFYAEAGDKVFSDLDPETDYYFRVYASAYEDVLSNPASLVASTVGAPLATPALAATETARHSITIEIGEIEGATGYVVEYSQNEDFSESTSVSYATAGVKTIANLALDATYYIRVMATARKSSGSEWATITAATEPFTGDKLDAPVIGLSGTKTAIVVKINPSDRAEGYVVEYGTDPKFATYSAKTYKTSGVKTISGLTSATWYYVRVRATSSDLTDSDYCATAKIYTGGSLPMPVVSASAVKTSVVLNIKEVSGGEKYVVEYSENEDFSNAKTKTFNSGVRTITGLTFGTRYYFRIKATGSEANDSMWNVINFAAGQLSTPKAYISEVGTTVATALCYNSSNASGFEVQYSTKADFSDAKFARCLGTPRCEISGLKPGTKYYFKARALGDNVSRVDSNWSTIFSATTFESWALLESPDLRIVPLGTKTLVQLVAVNSAPHYVLEYGTDPDFGEERTTSVICDSAGTIILPTNFAGQTDFYFRVKSVQGYYTNYQWTWTRESEPRTVVLRLDASERAATFSTSSSATSRRTEASLDDYFENYLEEDLEEFWDVLADSISK